MEPSFKRKAVGTAALMGIVCGLGVALFLLGYFSGTSKKVPVVVVSPDKLSFEDFSVKHERRLSVVRIPTDVKIEMKDAPTTGLDQIIRYKNEKATVYAVDTAGAGSIWTEDLVIGFADGKERDTKIYLCRGQTKSLREYTFYSTFENCWTSRPSGRPAGFTLPRSVPSPMHIPVFSCLTPEQNRYLSLNSNCESEKDSPQEMIGYVRAATVLLSEPVSGVPAAVPEKSAP